MSGKWGILLLEETGKKRALSVAGDLARQLGRPKIDVLSQLKRSNKFVMPYLENAEAQRGAGILVSAGIAAVPVSADMLMMNYASGFVRNADPNSEGLLIQDTTRNTNTLMPWTVVRAMFAVHRKPAPQKPIEIKIPTYSGEIPDHDQPLSILDCAYPESLAVGGVLGLLVGAGVELVAEALRGEPDMPSTRVSTTSTPEHQRGGNLNGAEEEDIIILIMGSSPTLVTCIERRKFTYDYLGARIQSSSKGNFPLLVKDICEKGRPIYVNHCVSSLLRGNLNELEEVEGRELSRWVVERIILLQLLEDQSIPQSALSALEGDECLLAYLE